MSLIEVRVPDIGDFENVPVIEVLVNPGDSINNEDSLITLESDKATLEVPSPAAGLVKELKVKLGDKVSEGTLILTLEADKARVEPRAPSAPAAQPAARAPAAPPVAAGGTEGGLATPPASRLSPLTQGADIQAEVAVLGAGPGGYTAAFRAADLGKKVVLIERYPTLGGVCLNVGCIPSKALLHIARVITEAEEAGDAGIDFGKPRIDIAKLRGWKAGVIGKLTRGLAGLARQRKVQVVVGKGEFTSSHTIKVQSPEGAKTIAFDHCVIAAGSSVARIPGFPYEDKRIFDSTGALELPEVPKRLLVVGGGIIGLEMAAVYDALGSRISVVELMDSLIPGADTDVVRVLHKRIEKRYEKILLKTKVARIEPQPNGLRVIYEGENAPKAEVFDFILMAVGRRPNGREIRAEAAGVNVNERGYIPVDKQLRTNVPHIYAVGDICGEPMLAHKATHEGKTAAEVIAGHKAYFDARAIPSVAYTDPEIAWMGLTETQAQAEGIEYEKALFPWAASGRALATGRDDGMTKLLFDKNSHRLLGAAMVGVNAGELVAETVLALEMGADAADIGLTIHPHPTLSETVFFAAEIAEGSITDLYMPKKPAAH
ncbi:MAG: dihydrolipoyl dehydrogenase [Betaproteobacteria bacterium RIFCSPLOWO2_12_FULL_62_13]|nr:MAG: dihydrolipoyl dehydrogenase [Betaproteobacteria bacterium RIFCSPLOWO2_12_FULL_62_13]